MESLWQDIPNDWRARILPSAQSIITHKIAPFLEDEYKNGQSLFPSRENIFSALRETPFEQVKVVILGQDPYHGEGQAHGLSFSVPAGIKPPPSLVNIYKELEREFGMTRPKSGNLTPWARQGVLLLNASLTVRAGIAGSHQKKGWEEFTDVLIESLHTHHEHLVFLLWGAYAQKKGGTIDRARHLVLEGPHPSPLSAHRGFIGCGHFSAANDYLLSHAKIPIDWLVL
jgi:uracil-DNA glycosylase